jgi:glycosyltransferase involved in cell wall biosynthesis
MSDSQSSSAIGVSGSQDSAAVGVSGSQALRLLVYTDSQSIGGAELALGYLLGALAEEIEVGVLATSAEVAAALAAYRPGAPVSVVPPPVGPRDRGALLAHVRAIRAHAPDILHANQAWPWACGYGEVAALLSPGVRVVAVDHLPVASAVPRRRVLARRLLARRLHAHVSVGERSARALERILGLRVGSVGAVPNGVPSATHPFFPSATTASPSPADSSFAAAPTLTADLPSPAISSAPASATAPVIGSLGRLTEQKGYDLLVRALSGLPDATLVLVGDGPQRGALEDLAARLGVADRLRITGWTGDPRSHLPAFDVFALPSRWEGMPLGILEAMHAGLPVVASDVGSVAETVSDGETGLLVAPDDAEALRESLAGLLADRPRRARMGERGRLAAIERFTDAAMARRYEAVYRAAMDGGSRRSA